MFKPLQLKARLDKIKSNHLWRTHRLRLSPQASTTQVHQQTDIHQKNHMNFSSNDYLGLANHPQVLAAYHRGLDEWGAGSGSAHLVSGHCSVHQKLEQQLADWLGFERVCLFSCGYMANMGVLSALADRGDLLFQDKLNHASLLDGAQLSRAQSVRFKHLDEQALEQRITQASGAHGFIVTDGLFSMDGDVAPIDQWSELAVKHKLGLIVDDAHGLGVLADKSGKDKSGKGSMSLTGVSPHQVTALVGTFGKAFGTSGAFVAGACDVIDWIEQTAKPYVCTTALSPAAAAATLESLRLIQQGGQRNKLQDLLGKLDQEAHKLGIDFGQAHEQSPIRPVLVGDERLCVQIGEQLLQAGFWVGTIRPPTVPKGTARLRISLNAEHQSKQVIELLQVVAKIRDGLGSKGFHGERNE